jgi:hypothetical protein
MKYLTAILAALPIVAQTPLTDAERSKLLGILDSGEKAYITAVSNVTPEQWKFKPAPERWSIADCAEHLILTEPMLFDLATKKLMQAPLDEPRHSDMAAGDDKLLAMIRDRSQKAKAPEMLVATGKWATPQEAIAEFQKRRAATREYVKTTQDDLRARSQKNPVWEWTDSYRYLLLLAAHTERHVAQMEEVKASPGYPK